MSPIIEIGECVQALERPGNALYQWNFVKDLKRRMRRKERFWPGPLRPDASCGAIRTVREFDEAYTAPYFGFAGAEDYYHRASAMRIVDRIRVPALVITAEDDPFVPSRPFHDPKLDGQPAHPICASASTAATAASSARRSAEDDGYWAENQIVEFVGSLAEVKSASQDLRNLTSLAK